MLVLSFVRWVLAAVWTALMSLFACTVMLAFPRFGWWLCAGPWARGALGLLGVRLDVHGAEHMATAPCIYVCNHTSYFDVVIMPALLPARVVFVAKRELKKIPFWGWGFARGGAVLIDRANARSAIESITTGVRELPPKWSIVIFPEGTRSRTGQTKPFKKGFAHMALATGWPIVPVACAGVRALQPPPPWLVRPGVVRVSIGEPIPTAHWREDNLAEHIDEVRRVVIRLHDEAAARAPGATMDAARPAPSP